jgi:superfamily II DNA or RNA helicase
MNIKQNIIPRKYQEQNREQIRESYRSGNKSVLYVLPTGGGKSHVFCDIAQRTAARGNPVVILVHRKNLLDQASRKLDDIGVPHGLIAPGHSMTGDPVQVASIQTFAKRLDYIKKPQLVIIDEAHHCIAGSYRKVLDYFPSAFLLGVTATPCRLDGSGLGRQANGYFDCMVEGPSIRELIDAGFLSQPIVYAPPTDFTTEGLHIQAGDYIKSEVGARIDKPKITGSAIDHYLRLCNGSPAITFCASVQHAEHVAEDFNGHGIRSVCLHGEMPARLQENCIRGLGDGTYQVLTSCDLISEGTDIPICGAGILLRPTASLGLAMQQMRRTLRIYPGKQHSIILDHVGNCLRHGLPDEVRSWSLDGIKRRKRGATDASARLRQCAQCYAVFSVCLVNCPQCGFAAAGGSPREIKQVDGELVKIEKQAQIKARRVEEWQADSLEDFVRIGKERGYAPGWAYIKYNLRKNKKNRALAAA